MPKEPKEQKENRKGAANRIDIQPSDGDLGAPNFVRVEKLPSGTTEVTFSILNSIGDRVLGPLSVATRGRRAQADIPFSNPMESGAYLGLIGTADGNSVMVTKPFAVGVEDPAEVEGEGGGGDPSAPAAAGYTDMSAGEMAEGENAVEGVGEAEAPASSGGPGRRRR